MGALLGKESAAAPMCLKKVKTDERLRPDEGDDLIEYQDTTFSGRATHLQTERAIFKRCHFDRVVLKHSRFRQTQFHDCTFEECSLSVILTQTQFHGCTFIRSNLNLVLDQASDRPFIDRAKFDRVQFRMVPKGRSTIVASFSEYTLDGHRKSYSRGAWFRTRCLCSYSRKFRVDPVPDRDLGIWRNIKSRHGLKTEIGVTAWLE